MVGFSFLYYIMEIRNDFLHILNYLFQQFGVVRHVLTFLILYTFWTTFLLIFYYWVDELFLRFLLDGLFRNELGLIELSFGDDEAEKMIYRRSDNLTEFQIVD